MMFKVETGAGWVWIDKIKKAETFGYVPNRKARQRADDSDSRLHVGVGDLGLPLYFTDLDDLVDAVEQMWGATSIRSFDSEIWPAFAQGQEATTVISAVLTLEDRTQVLALLEGGVDAFLLSEKGDTVERLAG